MNPSRKTDPIEVKTEVTDAPFDHQGERQARRKRPIPDPVKTEALEQQQKLDQSSMGVTKKGKRQTRQTTEQTNVTTDASTLGQDQQVQSRRRHKRNAFTLEDIAQLICEDPPNVMDVRDEQLCASLLTGMDRGMLEDMAAYFLTQEGIRSDERLELGPPKWNYTKGDPYDCFDYYVATGCPNCGSQYELDQPYAYSLNPPTLLCLQCNYRACPMHTNEESESLVDRLEAKTEQNEETITPITPLSGNPTSSSTVPLESPIYVRGIRERFDFGQGSKAWWQNRYVPRAIRLRELDRTITMISMMSKFKAPTIKEVCEVCRHSEAFYTTYQARSADEGMTIMYECTRCHHRKIFNN